MLANGSLINWPEDLITSSRVAASSTLLYETENFFNDIHRYFDGNSSDIDSELFLLARAR